MRVVATLRLAACQLNPVVGDLEGNCRAVLDALGRAEAAGADLAVFPELVLAGYPPEDLLLKPRFVADNRQVLDRVASSTRSCAAVVGFVEPSDHGLHNAAAVCASGRVLGTYRKRLLPNYSVFDEVRYFVPGQGPPPLFLVGGVRVGVSICEDAWSPSGPVAEEAEGGAELVVNINASPYYAGRLAERTAMLSERARQAGCPLVYLNQVGGQDELVFDGGSLAVGPDGAVVARLPQFREDLAVFDLEVAPRPGPPGLEVVEVSRAPRPREGHLAPQLSEVLGPEDEIYQALVTGTRDYLAKNGFDHALVGMSGGIDSSLVATIAADALGPARVHGVAMPSRYSSESSLADARRLASNLGIELRVVPIEPAHRAFEAMLGFEGEQAGLAGENLQSRIRGVVLMALSNSTGWIVLTTGNKSELATGYSTLYGDTAGGFAVIKDVPKTTVWRLARMRNRHAGWDLIPESVLTKAPSAELRPGQRDDQSLPPYEVLDPVLAAYVEQDKTQAELEEAGFDPELVRRVVRLVDSAEYKRRQSPIGVRVTPKAFGKDRRMPITNHYRGS
jgi:NAD+ synthase (glutamine-hydrolysing)